MSPLDLSICIVNWNRSDLLEQCLRSIYTTAQQVAFEVIVVDNGSIDESATMVTQRYPQVHLIKNTDNLGFARANNQALRVSKGRYCLLLNNDTLVLDRAFDLMVQFMDTHPDVGVLTCKIYNPILHRSESGAGADSYPTPGVVFWNDLVSLLGLHRLFPNSLVIQRCLWTGRDAQVERPVTHVTGACLMARKVAIDDVGLLDERFFMYLEETDWCYRFQKAGWGIYYTPEAEIVHFGEGSSHLRNDRYQLYYESLCKFFAKHYGTRAVLQYKLQEALIFSLIRKMRKLLGRRH